MRRRFMNHSMSFDYSNYLTIEAIEDVSVLFNLEVKWTTNGRKWETSKRVIAKAGQLVSIKRNIMYGEELSTTWSGGAYNLKGNIMSLLFGDDANGKINMLGYCLKGLFHNSNVITVEKGFLPATILADYCYQNMFYNCTSLATAPDLPATTLAMKCYNSMFNGCTSLANVPNILPATSLAYNCYLNMFAYCTSLVTAPELPENTLIHIDCYNCMFYGCSKLNYIKALFTTTPGISYTKNWVYGVSNKGTFVKNKNATWNVTGNNGIPNGWTVQTV